MGCCQNRDRCCSIWRIVQSSLGIFIGISTAFVFYHSYGNVQAAGWALTSGNNLYGIHPSLGISTIVF
jgi:hypothetical protein